MTAGSDATLAANSDKSQFFVCDSGSTSHISCDGNHFQTRTEISPRTIALSQEALVERILEKLRMAECKGAYTPLPMDVSKAERDAASQDEIGFMRGVPYRELVGSGMHLAVTSRFDIAHAVSVQSRHSHDPGTEDWARAKRLLRYLRRTRDARLVLGGRLLLEGCADSNFCAEERRRSQGGYLIYIGDHGPVDCGSNAIETVAHSSSESAYMALCQAVKTALWIRQILKDMRVHVRCPIALQEDNTACTAWTKGRRITQKTRHIDAYDHAISDWIEEGIFEINYCPSNRMRADLLTKALDATTYETLVAVANRVLARRCYMAQVS